MSKNTSSRSLAVALLTMSCLVTACSTPPSAPTISFERRSCDPVPERPGYCGTGILSMNRIGYRLVMVSPADPLAIPINASIR